MMAYAGLCMVVFWKGGLQLLVFSSFILEGWPLLALILCLVLLQDG